MKFKKLLALVLCMAMVAATATGCGTPVQSEEVVMTVGGTDVTLDEVWFYCKSVQEYYETYYSSMFTSAQTWASPYPVTDDDGNMINSTLEDIAKRSALKQIRQVKLAVQHADEYNVTISEADKQSIDEQVDEFMDEVTKEEKKEMGITSKVATRVFTESATVSKIKDAIAKKEGIEISDEEAKTSKIYYIYFPTAATDASGDIVSADAENVAKASADAEDALSRVLAGNDIATVAAAYGMGGSSGEMTVDADTVLDDNIMDAISELSDGEVYDKVLANDDGFYIIKMESVVDADATASKKEDLLEEKESELLEEKIEEWTNSEDFDYDKDVNWDYMDQIDFVATSTLEQSSADASSSSIASAEGQSSDE